MDVNMARQDQHPHRHSGDGRKGGFSGTVEVDGLGQHLSEDHVHQGTCRKGKAQGKRQERTGKVVRHEGREGKEKSVSGRMHYSTEESGRNVRFTRIAKQSVKGSKRRTY